MQHVLFVAYRVYVSVLHNFWDITNFYPARQKVAKYSIVFGSICLSVCVFEQ